MRSFELLGKNTRCVCEHSQRFVQEPKLFEKGEGVFAFLAHFAVRSLELLAGNTRCSSIRSDLLQAPRMLNIGCELCVFPCTLRSKVFRSICSS